MTTIILGVIHYIASAFLEMFFLMQGGAAAVPLGDATQPQGSQPAEPTTLVVADDGDDYQEKSKRYRRNATMLGNDKLSAGAWAGSLFACK